jgi:hypothetical protein
MKAILELQKVMKYRKNNFVTALLSLVITLTITFTGCYKESDTEFEDSVTDIIANSPELEDYIMADIEFQEAFNIFNTEIKNIDFSKLSNAQNAEENSVLYIPTSVCIESKANLLNEKKKLLISAYPQLNSFSPEVRQKCFQQALENSPTLSRKILESGINIYQPRLKGGSVEFLNKDNFLPYLAQRVGSSDYVEVIILIFKDGTVMAYTDYNATPYSSSITLYQNPTTGEYYTPYYAFSTVKTHIHTHTSGPEASSTDIQNKKSGIEYKIYYSGSINYAY